MNGVAPEPYELSMGVLIPWQVRKIESVKLNARERDSSLCTLLSIWCEPGACPSLGGKAALRQGTARARPRLPWASPAHLCPDSPQDFSLCFLQLQVLKSKDFLPGACGNSGVTRGQQKFWHQICL